MTFAAQTKRILKRMLKRTLGIVGGPEASAGSASRILTYHSVGMRSHEMNVAPVEFARQICWLAENHPIIDLEQAALGRPGIAITFDDGYADNLVYAAPILGEFQLPATIFVVAGRMGEPLFRDNPAATERLLRWDDLREMTALGFAVGAHTLTHPRLADLPPSDQAIEIAESKHVLEQHLSREVRAFAYPYGSVLDYTATTVRLVQEAGFCYACSNQYGINRPGADRWTLRRIWIDATDDLAMFKAKIEGKLDLLRLLDTRTGARLRRKLNQYA